MSDHPGAALKRSKLPPAQELLTDRACNASGFRAEIVARGIAAYVPSTRSRTQPLPRDAALHRHRHHIENMFGRL